MERFNEDYRDFETLYDAIIIKNNGDTITGKMFHLKYSTHKFFIYKKGKKNRLESTKIYIIEINHLIIDGEYYGSYPMKHGKHAACYRILNKNGFEVYKTIEEVKNNAVNNNSLETNRIWITEKKSYYLIYYLSLDGQDYKISESNYRPKLKMEKDKLYTIFFKYGYFKVNRKTLDMMSIEGIILLYSKLRKEQEAKTDNG